ncbi:MAG: hypothetical protein HOP18_15480, partial [Deltaproteobacteria bacterium]|nr:hypothetical protein [Deltaproteobacteria bacterium]
DRDPPPAPDLGKITVSDPSNGKVRVSGTAGSVEAGGRVVVTNMATGAQATGIANADGSFSVEIVAGEGQSLSLVVTDAAGNASPARTAQVGVAVRISITEPAEGTRTQHQRTLVRGTVHGPLNTGVIVNGVVAAVHDGEFVADDIPLSPVIGTNDYTITATATTLGGQTVGTSVTVQSWGNPEVLEVDASVTSGVAPLDVAFSYTFGSTIPLQTLRLDADGNGTFEVTTTDPTAPLHYTYSTPAIYIARLQATDQQGGTFTAQVPVVVQDVTTMDTMFKSMWSNMNTALVAGDTTAALTFLDSAAQQKYGPVWQVLLPHMAEIVASYSPVRGVGIGQNVAEYGVNRTIDGENRLFLIYFLKDKDGVWRLAAM